MIHQPSAPLGIIDDFQFHQKAVVGMGLLGIYGCLLYTSSNDFPTDQIVNHLVFLLLV